MNILGIESTCDETGVAIVENGRKIIKSLVSSSQGLHKKYGGVVPEVAAREQIKVIVPLLREVMAGSSAQKLDAIAVSYGPGLVGSLLVGVESAKSLALVWDKPLIGVNHLVGHIYANWIELTVNRELLIINRKKGKNDERETISDQPSFPLVALIVSGGHTDLVLMTGHGKYKWLGGTLDDACGEAYDKVAKVLGLGYPGGPEIEKLASQFPISKSRTPKVRLPRPMIDSGDFDFSFSGLKTAVVNYVNKNRKFDARGVAYEFQNAASEVLVKKTLSAAKKFAAKSIVVGGGVAANTYIKNKMRKAAAKNNFSCFFPSKDLAVDNGVMIASAAFFEKKEIDPLKLAADSSLHFSS